MPVHLARAITERVSIPTIGIGAGVYCDGQVQVFHDLLGLYTEFLPKHAKRYANVGDVTREAVRAYAEDVRSGRFPTDAESFIMDTPLFSEPSQATSTEAAPRRRRATA